MTYIFAKLVQNSLLYHICSRLSIHAKISKFMSFIQEIIYLFPIEFIEYEKLAVAYSRVSVRPYEKKFSPDHSLFFEIEAVSPTENTQKTLFNTTSSINKMKKMVGYWLEPFFTPQYNDHVIRLSGGLIRSDELVGYTRLSWQFLRFQWQRWSCFNAHWGNLQLKRLLDIVVSTTVLILLSPFLFIIALLIYIDSPGPIFFSQQRIGQQGRAFTMWKFRSMHVDAEKHKAVLMKNNEMSDGILFKMKNDPRITRIGKFIRKFSIDEIPQLFNVLIGEMSLVGPRPPLPNEVAKYTPYHRQRLEVAPGITCYWQISGRNEIPFPKQVELDLHYITTQSFIGDITLLLKTVPAVIKGHGAY